MPRKQRRPNDWRNQRNKSSIIFSDAQLEDLRCAAPFVSDTQWEQFRSTIEEEADNHLLPVPLIGTPKQRARMFDKFAAFAALVAKDEDVAHFVETRLDVDLGDLRTLRERAQKFAMRTRQPRPEVRALLERHESGDINLHPNERAQYNRALEHDPQARVRDPEVDGFGEIDQRKEHAPEDHGGNRFIGALRSIVEDFSGDEAKVATILPIARVCWLASGRAVPSDEAFERRIRRVLTKVS